MHPRQRLTTITLRTANGAGEPQPPSQVLAPALLMRPALPATVPEFDFSRVPASAHPLVLAAPLADCELCVVIPVHNEEAVITRTLAALARQVDLEGRPLDRDLFEILLLANNCVDRTARLARSFASAHPGLHLHVVDAVLPPPHAHVGAARRLIMDEACRRLGRLGRPRGVIASTDGDTEVQPNWVAAILREVARGADAVGGRIQASREELAAMDTGARSYYLRDLAYRTLRAAYEGVLAPDPFDPWPRHHHCFGASLAVTAETYREAGGLPVLPCLEDMAFCRALEQIDARLRHSPEVIVRTSMRTTGKVCVGLSGTLAIWVRAAAAGEPWLVESAAAIESSVAARLLVQSLWNQGRQPGTVAAAAARLEVSPPWLDDAWQQATTKGELYRRVHDRQQQYGTGPFAWQPVEVRLATAELRRRLRAHRATLRGAARLQVLRQNEDWCADEEIADGMAA